MKKKIILPVIGIITASLLMYAGQSKAASTREQTDKIKYIAVEGIYLQDTTPNRKQPARTTNRKKGSDTSGRKGKWGDTMKGKNRGKDTTYRTKPKPGTVRTTGDERSSGVNRVRKADTSKARKANTSKIDTTRRRN